jgi:hypothetical protein
MKLGAVAHGLEQVLALADTPVDYIRLGYPYCRGLAEYCWPQDKLETALETVATKGKIAQFQWLISPLTVAQAYVDSCIEIIKKFPQTEIVVGYWGGLEFPLPDVKLVADGLAIYNSDLVRLMRERGISIIGLPLKLDTEELLSAVIDSSPADTVFEYQLWGAVMASHWWKCATDKDSCNPITCAQFIKFDHQHEEFGLYGSALWYINGVDNLSRTKELTTLGIERGLIQLADIPSQAIAELIDYCLAIINE